MKQSYLSFIACASLLSAGLARAQYTGIDDAAPIAVQLGGATKRDGWYNLSTGTKVKVVDGSSYTIPGLTGYPTALSSSPAWSSPVYSQLQSDSSHKASFNKVSNGNGSSYVPGYDSYGISNGLSSFNPDGTKKTGATWKKANGTTGADGYGPIPSGDSLYAISFSNDPNVRQGTVGVFEAAPVAELKSVVFQVELGSANGYDFWNHSVDGLADNLAVGPLDSSTAFPQIRLTLADSSEVTLAADFAQLTTKGFNGMIQMPTGPDGALEDQPIYINLYGFQWDLSAYTGVQSFNITWSDVEHSQLYAFQLDQSSEFNQVVGAVPEPSTWAMAVLGCSAAFVVRRWFGLARPPARA